MKGFRDRLEREPFTEKGHRFLSQLIITDVDRALIAKSGEALECSLFLAYWSRHGAFGFLNLRRNVNLLLLVVDWEWNVLVLRLRNLFRHKFVLNFWDALAVESRQCVADLALLC